MNQDQRKFLITHITKAYDAERKKLKEDEPKEPSLNNYLVAAVLDGSFKLRSTADIRTTIHEMVLELGPEAALIGERRRRHYGDEPDTTISVEAKRLFILPKGYETALEKYEKEYEIWNKKMEQIEAIKETLILKIQIGSNAVLDRLVEQADNMADLNLMNNRLQLTAGESK